MLKCSILYRPIIKAAQVQTSADLRALRVKTPQVDAVYDDFVLTDDEYKLALEELRGEITDSLYAYFRPSVIEVIRDNSEGMYISFKVSQSIDLAVMESLIQNTLKYALLKWWYAQRSEAHFAAYTQKFITALQELDSLIRSRIVYGQGSYY